MEVFFRSKKLRKDCEDDRRCCRRFGKQAEKVQLRLNQLEGAGNLAVFQNPQLQKQTGFHLLIGDKRGKYAMYLIHPHRLIIQPVDEKKLPEEVTEIIITSIEDYH